MYELGLAHAIGKSTLILTHDPSSLPFDIKTKFAETIDPEKKEETRQKVTKAMNYLLQEMDASQLILTSPKWKQFAGINEFHAPSTLFFQPEFWKSTKIIFEFLQNIDHNFFPLHLHLERISQHTNYIVACHCRDALESENVIPQFTQLLNDYKLFYWKAQKIFIRIQSYKGLINDAFQSLLKCSSHQNTKSNIVAHHESCQKIISQIENFIISHNRIFDEDNINIQLTDPAISTKFAGQVAQLTTNALWITSIASTTITRLLQEAE